MRLFFRSFFRIRKVADLIAVRRDLSKLTKVTYTSHTLQLTLVSSDRKFLIKIYTRFKVNILILFKLQGETKVYSLLETLVRHPL